MGNLPHPCICWLYQHRPKKGRSTRSSFSLPAVHSQNQLVPRLNITKASNGKPHLNSVHADVKNCLRLTDCEFQPGPRRGTKISAVRCTVQRSQPKVKLALAKTLSKNTCTVKRNADQRNFPPTATRTPIPPSPNTAETIASIPNARPYPTALLRRWL